MVLRPACHFLGALAFAACGPDFTGRWVGSLNEMGSCSDGSGIPSSSYPIDWSISEQGSKLSVITTGTCGSFTATQQGSSAAFDRKDCPIRNDLTTGVTTQMHLTGGTLNLNEATMSVTVLSTYDVRTPSAAGTCSATATGLLAKQR